VDYDIPTAPKIRMRFYREIKALLLGNGESWAKYSTKSVLITNDEALAKSLYFIARKYGKARLYVGHPVTYDVSEEYASMVAQAIAGRR